MRRLTVVLVIVLVATGLALTWLRAAFPPVSDRGAALLHIWGGVVFLVVFPLYAWDHVATHLRWLRRWRLVTLSGIVQALAGALLLPTGVLLLLYGTEAWLALRSVHHWLTYPIALALLLHWRAPKYWRRPRGKPQR